MDLMVLSRLLLWIASDKIVSTEYNCRAVIYGRLQSPVSSLASSQQWDIQFRNISLAVGSLVQQIL